MGYSDFVFGKDIVLDEEAFSKAIADFDNLQSEMRSLRTDIEQMLSEIEQGFNTPAGRKFIESCKANLLKPLDDQVTVLQHISENIKQSNGEYKSVFEGYRQLNSKINSF